MGTDNLIYLEVLEWLDPTGRELVHRLPEGGSGEIKLGAQLTVRESQAAVLFYQGKAYDAFGPGRHTLVTGNIPILTKLLSIPWGMKSPLRAEVYFVSLKDFANLTWGTRDPVAFKDSKLGLIRLRAHGVFNVKVVQPVLLINSLVGTQGVFTTEQIEEYLARVIVSRFNDHLGEHLDSVLDLPGTYEELSAGLSQRLAADFARYGLALTQLVIVSVTPPAEVQKAIDDKSRLGVFDDLNKLLQLKAAMAVEKIAEQQGAAGAGAGMGLGLMMPALFTRAFGDGGGAAAATTPCPSCGHPGPADARFCARCGAQVVLFQKCARCAEDIAPGARFCARCGTPAGARPQERTCAKCGLANLPDSVFCNQCGEKLG
jgi:membrane protease subunit (stomatin/prohibitin family)